MLNFKTLSLTKRYQQKFIGADSRTIDLLLEYFFLVQQGSYNDEKFFSVALSPWQSLPGSRECGSTGVIAMETSRTLPEKRHNLKQKLCHGGKDALIDWLIEPAVVQKNTLFHFLRSQMGSAFPLLYKKLLLQMATPAIQRQWLKGWR